MMGHRNGRRGWGTVFGWAAAFVIAGVARAVLPPVPVPPQNPITEPKRVLGKILFFDEQLSFDNTVACATCHTMTRGGGDARRARNPGSDNAFNTPDDVFGSPGVIGADAVRNYLRSTVYGLGVQVTGRGAPSPINAAFGPLQFWDGRGSSQFVDPQTGQTLIPVGGSLESQIVQPPVNTVEMGHEQIDWLKVSTKLAYARPLALATNLPPDVSAVLLSKPTYGQLFAAAFGDATVNAARVAMAIATYERTLISDQTPFDLGTMTPQQNQGFGAFQASNCAVCHAVPPNAQFFTDNTFRNIGLRPPAEDLGRQNVTGNNADRGRFKVPGLRNVGLKTQFMHNGMFTTLPEVIAFYARAPGAPQQFPDNRDPVMPQVNVPPQAAGLIQAFLAGGLLDPRVRDGLPPFDAPVMYGERPADRPVLSGTGVAGTSGIAPVIIAVDPPFVGNTNFRIGLDRALGGATVRLITSSTPPDASGNISAERTMDTKISAGSAGVAGDGYATEMWPLLPGTVVPGQVVWAQWIVDDAGAPGGEARSNVAGITFFCGSVGCPAVCEADTNEDANLTVQDLFSYLARWFTRDLRADLSLNGMVESGDLFAYLGAWFAGC